MRKALWFLLIIAWVSLINAVIIQIGDDQFENQGLPWNVTARYSYVQQIYPSGSIGVGGSISSIAFQYNVFSNIFFDANRSLTVYMGHTDQEALTDWIPVSELTEVFSGDISIEDFSVGIPGQGWFTLNLPEPFYYNLNHNLVIAIDENSSGYGNTADDFFCTPVTMNRALRYNSMSINPDPASPPTTNLNNIAYLANLRLDISGEFYQPHNPLPVDLAEGIELSPSFSWDSDAQVFDLLLGTSPASLSPVAQSITQHQWTVSNPLEAGTQYYWQVVAHREGNDYASPVWSFFTAGGSLSAPRNLTGQFTGNSVLLTWEAPPTGNAAGYEIYRDGSFLADRVNRSYRDYALTSNTTYSYSVRAVSAEQEYSPFTAPCLVNVGTVETDLTLREDFESYPAFSQEIGDWLNHDLDHALTWSWDSYNFPGEGTALGWITFAPEQVLPPLSSVSPYDGNSMLCSISSTEPPSNDLLISKPLYLGSNPALSFKARSHTTAYGLERLRVLISTGSTDPADFILLSPAPYLQIPAIWTNYTYDLSAYQNSVARLAFNAVSWDAFALYLDLIEIRSQGGSTTDDALVSAPHYQVYPNPSRGDFIVQSSNRAKFDLELFDVRGRLILCQDRLEQFDSRQSDLRLSNGLYLLRVTDSSGNSTRQKLIILK